MLLSKCRLSNNRLDNFLLSKQTLGNFYLDGPAYGSGGQLIDHSAPVQVVNAAYDTSGNGGRKLVRLNSGNLYAAMRNGTSAWYIYKSTDNGGSWSLFKTVTISVNDIALATNGTNIYIIISHSTSGVKCYAYNEAGTVLVNGVDVDTSQSAMGLCSLTMDSSGHLHAAWVSKNSTYPNSVNIRYSKSVDGGVTWATPTQVTIINVSDRNYYKPCINLASDGEPIVICENIILPANNIIVVIKPTGLPSGPNTSSNWTYGNVYSGGTYVQADPCATVGSNGHINCTWQGYGATHTSTYHVFFKSSADNGVTWTPSTPMDVAVGENPSITHDKDNNIYIQYERSGVIYQKKSTDHGATWGAETTIATGANVNTCNNYNNFTQPLNIFDGGSDVKFSGVFYS